MSERIEPTGTQYDDITAESYIDTLITLKAQIESLKDKESALSEWLQKYMESRAITELRATSGHKAKLTEYEESRFDREKMIADLGAQAYEHFCVPKTKKRFTVR